MRFNGGRMNARVVLLVLFVVAVAGFAALNWSAFLTQTTLSIGVATINAPLGLLLLGLILLLTALFLMVLLYMQTSVFREARQHSKDLQVQRDLAEQAEASRFIQLREYLEEESKRAALRDDEFKAVLFARVERLEADLRAAIENSGNTMGAYIGELEQRLEQRTGRDDLEPR